jgi:hypothetical protein
LTTNRSVGLWMLPAHVSGSRSMLAAVQQDFARLRTLEHPSIARLIELGSNGQQHYVTGERLDGEPLREVLNQLLPERPEVGEADEILRAIGSALAYAHERGIAHGDVRAENVVVTMDRRFVLTNFLARRIAKVASRAPRPADDLKGFARLAAELYTGSISPHSLRSAAHGEVPAARLNAIRAVLEPGNRRPDSVADFLLAAGLGQPAAVVAPRPVATPSHKPQRSWSLWRLVVPMAAITVLGSLGAAYHGGVRASAEELKERGLDALRAVAARVTPSADDAPPATAGVTLPEAEPAPDLAEAEPAAEEPAEAEPREPEPLLELHPAAALPAERHTPIERQAPVERDAADERSASAAPAPESSREVEEPNEPAVVTLAVPRIAAREDHSVVAIDVVRSGDTSRETAVSWWTSPDTAHEEEDYAGVGRQTLRFPAGATVQRALIPIVNDGVRESAEVFMVHLARPHGGVPGEVTTARVTLHDDD